MRTAFALSLLLPAVSGAAVVEAPLEAPSLAPAAAPLAPVASAMPASPIALVTPLSAAPWTPKALAAQAACPKAADAAAPGRAAVEARAVQVHEAVRADPQLRNVFDGWTAQDAVSEQHAVDRGNTRLAVAMDEPHLAETDASGRSKRLTMRRGALVLKLRPGYVGEQHGGRVTFSGEPPVYLSRAAAAEHEPLVKDGLVYDREGRALHGVYKIVLDPRDGALFVDVEGRSDRSHSSYLAGRPTAGAGSAVFVRGKLLALGPHTGHYAVSRVFLAQVALALRARGAALDETRLLPLMPYSGPQALFDAASAR